MRTALIISTILPVLSVLLACGFLSSCATPGGAGAAATASVEQLLYPPLEPYRTGFLPVSKAHSLYYEESGNPAGVPVVFLHGGPGSGTKPKQRRFFDPARFHIILFDQAGAGKSVSPDPLAENNTAALVAHLEKLRAHLGVERWLLFGGSWGATLALAYAEAYPAHVSGIITWGVFLSRPQELDWMYKRGGASSLHPEAFAHFESFVPPRGRDDLVAAYLRLFHSRDLLVRREAVRRWTEYEDVLAIAQPEPPEPLTDAELDGRVGTRALIEAHYMRHLGFLDPKHNELLAGAGRLRGIPITVIAGRFDLVCPVTTAYDFVKAAPWAELRVVPLAGHLSMGHAAVTAALVSAADHFR